MCLSWKNSEWTELTAEIIKNCCSRYTTTVHRMASLLPASSIDVPSENVGCSYLLRSVPECHLLYTSSTVWLTRRLREQNAGLGALFTKFPWRRPWVVCAFITGFQSEHAATRIRSFEKKVAV